MEKNLWLVEGECGSFALRATKASAIMAVEEHGVEDVAKVYEVKIKSISVLERNITVALKTLSPKTLEIP